MNVQCHQTWQELAPLRDAWNAALSDSASDAIFLTWEWAAAWWKNYGAGRSLFLLTAWEGDLLLGVAPFYADPVFRWGMKWVSLKLVGDGSNDSDYLDCFVRRGREAEVTDAFVRYLDNRRETWDELEIHGVPEGSASLKMFVESGTARGWRVSKQPILCATLPLPSRWDDYLPTLKSRFRTKIRSSLVFLDVHMRTVPRACCKAAQLDEWLPILFELHTKRWQTVGKPGVFQDPAKRSFYHDLSRLMLERNCLAFHRLDWGERPLAVQYGFLYRDRFYLLQEGFDPDFESLRPGLTLRASLLRTWIERGLAEYDFLAGTAAYKLDWGAQQKLCLRVAMAHSRPGTAVFLGFPRMRERAKEVLRAFVPDAILKWRKSWLTKRAHKSYSAEPAQVANGHFPGLARRLFSRLYEIPVAGKIGHGLAARYTLVRGAGPNHMPSLRRRSGPIFHILIYHRVNDDHDPFLPALSSDGFRDQMEYIAANFPVVTLDQVAQGIVPQSHHAYSVAITFDDGYRDNFLNAFPVLKELGLPATIFLATGCIESGELAWYNQVSLAFKLTARRHLHLGGNGSPQGALGSQEERLRALRKTLEWLWKLPEADRLRSTRDLLQALGVPATLNLPNAMLNWNEICLMRKQGITFGAHTVTHPVLSRVCEKRLEEEICGSKQAIEDRLQQSVKHFAYPFGRRQDISAAAKRAVQQAGFATAVTTEWGFNSLGDDPFELKRFSPWETERGLFAFKLDWYRFFGVGPAQADHRPNWEG